MVAPQWQALVDSDNMRSGDGAFCVVSLGTAHAEFDAVPSVNPGDADCYSADCGRDYIVDCHDVDLSAPALDHICAGKDGSNTPLMLTVASPRK